MCMLILGIFSIAWFSWARAQAPESLQPVLWVGALLGLLTALGGGFLSWRNWSGQSTINSADAMRRYNLISGLEFGLILLGIAGLVLLNQPAYIAPWVCIVVGVHFWPLASLFEARSLKILSGLMVIAAVSAVLIAQRSDIHASTVVGTAAGALFLLYSAAVYVSTLRSPSSN